jgi:hypothetical protein
MAVTNVNNKEAGALSLVDIMQEARAASQATSGATLASSNNLLASAQNRKAQSAYDGGGRASSTIGQAALQRALSEMEGSGGKITFKQIMEHKDRLELEFTVNLRAELLKVGVPLETEFSLSMDRDGKISVLCDDPVMREKIQKFLADNPKMCEQFGYIQALSNLERAQQSPASAMSIWKDVRSSTAGLQTQAIEAFFGAAINSGMDYSGIMANFAPGGNSKASFFTGLNFTV